MNLPQTAASIRKVLVLSVANVAVLGSLYAWSVFLYAVEQDFDVGREQASLVFSTAILCFTVAMLTAPWLYRVGNILHWGACASLLGATGLALAAGSPAFVGFLIGYGVLFGTANGIGYSIALQTVQYAQDRRRGLTTGIVVSGYAVGATVLAPILAVGLAYTGLSSVLFGLSLVLAMVGTIMLAASRNAPRPTCARDMKGSRETATKWRWLIFIKLWIGFALSTAASLMVIAHAAAMIMSFGGTVRSAAAAPALIAAANAVGRLSAGWMADHLPVRSLLAAAMLIALVAFLILAQDPGTLTALFALTLVGLSYGCIAAGYPAAVSAY